MNYQLAFLYLDKAIRYVTLLGLHGWIILVHNKCFSLTVINIDLYEKYNMR